MEIAVLIVNSIAAFMAVVAAIIGLYGNCQSKKQFEVNLRLQIKALNYSLLKERLEILKHLISKEKSISQIQDEITLKINWNVEEFKLLFSEQAYKIYNGLNNKRQEINDIELSRRQIDHSILAFDPDSDRIKKDSIEARDALLKSEKEYKYANDEEKQNALIKFKNISSTICQSRNLQDYAMLTIRLENLEKEYENQKQELIQFLENEIADSIK